MENCIFCKIINNEINSIKVYEDVNFIAIEDITPTNKGHTLIIPKKHSENILEMDSETSSELTKIIKKIGKSIIKGLGAKGFNTIINTGKEAGQEVFHTHIHIIPRFENDKIEFPKGKETTKEELILTAEKIIKNLD